MRFAYRNLLRVSIEDYDERFASEYTCAEGHPVIARRGEKVIHHFAHKSRINCSCGDNKGVWHLKWQDRVQKSYQEVRITLEGKLHIADTFIPSLNLVIEYQHSPMNSHTILKRENFYTQTHNLLWVFDTTNWEYRKIREVDGIVTIMRKSGPIFPSYASFEGKVRKIFDFGKEQLFLVQKQNKNIYSGKVLSMQDFDIQYLQDCCNSGNDMRPFHHPLFTK